MHTTADYYCGHCTLDAKLAVVWMESGMVAKYLLDLTHQSFPEA